MNRFLEVTAHLEQILSGISYEKLDISDEVKEQVGLNPWKLVLSFFQFQYFILFLISIP